jgi:D-glycero-alpha-D-manno-heptose-7-phosphate kinase
MTAFEAVAPTRIDLAGGTLDIWPVYLMLDGPVTVNLGLALPVRASVRPAPRGRIVLRSLDHGTEEGFRSLDDCLRRAKHRLAAEALRSAAGTLGTGGVVVETASGVPPGSGLGGSSALAVALLAALRGGVRSQGARISLALSASNMEGRVIQVPPGSQDHLAAACGSLSAWHYGIDGVRREVLSADPGGLASRLVLAYTGVTHSSAVNNWRVTRAFLDGDAGVRRGFAEVAKAAREVREAVVRKDLGGVAGGMDRDSRARRRLFPGFHTERTLALAAAARRAGAVGGRPCGAGGGGSMVFVVEDVGRREAVERALLGHGATILPVVPDLRGVRVRRVP